MGARLSVNKQFPKLLLRDFFFKSYNPIEAVIPNRKVII
jgi:hypothetical protein